MILSKKIGNKVSLNEEMTCSKEEFLEAIKNGTFDDLLVNTGAFRQIVAFDIVDEDKVIIEDTTGLLHVCYLGAFHRTGFIDELDYLKLKSVDFSVKVTEPFSDFDYNNRAQYLIDSAEKDNE